MNTYFLDVLGEMCPIPILRAEQRLKDLKPGDVLVVESDHSCVAEALPPHFRKKRCRVTVTEVANGIWQIQITKP